MNALFGFGGLANAGLTAASAAKSRPSMNRYNNNKNNNNNYVPFQNTRKKVGNLAKKATSTLTSLFGMKKNETPAMAPLAPPASTSSLNQYKSKAASSLGARTRKNKRMSNVYVPSNTEAPNVNLSYVKNRNESVRNALNEMMVGRSFNGSQPNLTNTQRAARTEVARKMARGESVSMAEKVAAGMRPAYPKPSYPKPSGPRPSTSGGKRSRKASRRRRTVRRR